MDASAIATLGRELIATIALLSTYSAPADLPDVHVVPQSVLQEKFCNGPCRIRAAYHPESGLYLDDRLDITENAVDRSVFLHELVHHLQARAGHFDPSLSECERASREEREAYEIQNRYLARAGVSRRFPLPRFAPACRAG